MGSFPSPRSSRSTGSSPIPHSSSIHPSVGAAEPSAISKSGSLPSHTFASQPSLAIPSSSVISRPTDIDEPPKVSNSSFSISLTPPVSSSNSENFKSDSRAPVASQGIGTASVSPIKVAQPPSPPATSNSPSASTAIGDSDSSSSSGSGKTVSSSVHPNSVSAIKNAPPASTSTAVPPVHDPGSAGGASTPFPQNPQPINTPSGFSTVKPPTQSAPNDASTTTPNATTLSATSTSTDETLAASSPTGTSDHQTDTLKTSQGQSTVTDSNAHTSSTKAPPSLAHSSGAVTIPKGILTELSTISRPSLVPTAEAAVSASNSGFFQDKAEEAGVFLVVSFTAIALGSLFYFLCRRRLRQRRPGGRTWEVFNQSLNESSAAMRQASSEPHGDGQYGIGYHQDASGSYVMSPSTDSHHAYTGPILSAQAGRRTTFDDDRRMSETRGPSLLRALVITRPYIPSYHDHENPFNDDHTVHYTHVPNTAVPSTPVRQNVLAIPVPAQIQHTRRHSQRPSTSGRSSPSLYPSTMSVSSAEDADSLYEKETSAGGHEAPSFSTHPRQQQQRLYQDIEGQLAMPQPVRSAMKVSVPKVSIDSPRAADLHRVERAVMAPPPRIVAAYYEPLTPPASASSPSTSTNSPFADGGTDSFITSVSEHVSPQDQMSKSSPISLHSPIQDDMNPSRPVVPPRNPRRMTSPAVGIAV